MLVVPRYEVGLILAVISLLGSQSDVERLIPGKAYEGEIVGDSPPIFSGLVAEKGGEQELHGVTRWFRVGSSGTYSLRLESNHFSSHLILQNERSEVLAESDDDYVPGSPHCVLSHGLDGDRLYSLVIASSKGLPGPYRLTIEQGVLESPPPDEARAIVEEILGEHLRAVADGVLAESETTYEFVNGVGLLYNARGEHDLALARFEQAVEIHGRTVVGPSRDGWIMRSNAAWSLRQLGRHEEAAALYGEVLEGRRALLGQEHHDYVNGCVDFGDLQYERRLYPEAATLYAEAARLAVSSEQFDPRTTAIFFMNAAYALDRLDRRAEAVPLFREAIALCSSSERPDEVLIARLEYDIGYDLHKLGIPSQAEPHLRRAVEMRTGAFGPGDERVDGPTGWLARVLEDLGRYEEAIACRELVVANRVERLGTEHEGTADAHSFFASTLRKSGLLERALEVYLECLRVRRAVHGANHPDVARTLREIAMIHDGLGNSDLNLSYHQDAVESLDRSAGAEPEHLASLLQDLGTALHGARRYDEALAAHQRSLALRTSGLPPEDSRIAASLRKVGMALSKLGRTDEALTHLQGARRHYEEHAPEDPFLHEVLSSIALALDRAERDVEAEGLYHEAVRIAEKTPGLEEYLASHLLGLAGVLSEQKRFTESRAHLERSVNLLRGANLPKDLAMHLQSLAYDCASQGEVGEGEWLLRESLALQEESYGPESGWVASSLNKLGMNLGRQGRHEEAHAVYRRALETKGCSPATRWQVQSNLGVSLFQAGQLEQAELMHRKCLEELSDSDQSDFALANTHNNLAVCLLHAGKHTEAFEASMETSEAFMDALKMRLPLSDTAARFRFVAMQERNLNRLISTADALPDPSAAADVLWSTIVEWQGLVFRCSRSAARNRGSWSEQDLADFERLKQLKSELSRNVFGSRDDRPGGEDGVEDMYMELRVLEASLSSKVGGDFEVESLSPRELVQLLPEGHACVSFYFHKPWVHERGASGSAVESGYWAPDRVLALVVRPDSQRARLIDLGPATVLESATRAHLTEIAGWAKSSVPRRAGVGRTLGGGKQSNLDEILWKPLAGELEGCRRIFVISDRFLAELPFGTISLDDGRFLLEQADFVYVQDQVSLRDELRKQHEPKLGEPVLLAVGGLDFDSRDRPKTPRSPTSSPLRGGFDNEWQPLGGSRAEIHGILEQHRRRFEGRGGRLALEGSEAVEERVKVELQRATHVHLATHGFFEAERFSSLFNVARSRGYHEGIGLEANSGQWRAPTSDVLPPFLLAGVVLSGANLDEDGVEDGLLTAAEVQSLDLRSCELAVLSACETGLGATRSGEGLLSLRRAFREAGVHSVISSLWRVEDDATRALMLDFYQRLWGEGKPHSVALREARLAVLNRKRASGRDSRPDIWGAFVLAGRWW